MGKSIQFAIVGCGQIAHKHAETLTNHVPGAKLAAICDVDAARSEAFAGKYGVPGFHSIEQMLTTMRSRIDVVNVLTPSGYHAQNVLEVVGHGCKNVVVEKPMALTLEDAREMVAVCDRARTRLFVVAQNRYNKPVQALAQAVRSGRFGKLVAGTVRMRWCRPQHYYQQSAWRGTWAMDGGVFANQAHHHLDLLCWLLGDVDFVSAYTARQLANIEAEDTGVAILRFQCGALGVIEATTATRPHDLEGSISILGEHGAVEIGGFAANKLSVWEFDHSDPQDAIVKRDHAHNPPHPHAYGHAAYLRDVVHCIQADQQAMVGGRDGLQCLRLIHAIYQSTHTRTETYVPGFTPTHSRLGRKSPARFGRLSLDEPRELCTQCRCGNAISASRHILSGSPGDCR
jgi:predicted dehydrogenase